MQGSEKYESFTNTQKVGLQQTFISMEYDHYLQLIDIAGNTTVISLLQDDVGIPNIKEAAEGRHQVLCVDSDGENIIALEGIETKGTTKYYITKYASDYNCVFVLDISSIFKDYAITNRIWTFQAFGDYFLLSDYYGTSILCRCKDHEIEMIFCESNIEYVDNYCNNGEFEHFYVPETNDIYRLDLHTGTLEIQDYDLENEKYVIRNMFAYDDKLLIAKYRGEKYTGEGENEEVLYLISVEDLLPGITPADNPGDLTSLTFSAILPFSLGADGAFIKTEWINANPWTEDAELSTLPVFVRSFTYTEDYPMPKVDEEVAEALMVHAASSLGQDASQLEIRNGISSLAANTENMNISVDYTLSTSISLKKPVSLPDKYDISSDASYEDKQKAAKYIRKKYKKLIEMSKPVINITDEYSSSDLTISFYEGKGTLEEQIINYNFNRIVFYGNDKGELHFIRRNQLDLSYIIGDYPLISVEEAKALLGAGNYYDILGARPTPFDMYPEGDFPGLDSVKMVELVYLSTTNYNIFIPFYCFYAGDLYYVPAIEPQYIVNMPINGYFPEVE